jgi:hypothetical protein
MIEIMEIVDISLAQNMGIQITYVEILQSWA